MSIIVRIARQRFISIVTTLSILIFLLITTIAFGQTPDSSFDYTEHGQPTFILDWVSHDYSPHPTWNKRPLHLVERRVASYSEGLQHGYGTDAADWLEVGDIENDNSQIITSINSNLIYIRWLDQYESEKYQFANSNEFTFMHTTDPASTVVYQTESSIVLHWRNDRRFVMLYHLNGIGLYGADPNDIINTYQIWRKGPSEVDYSNIATVNSVTTFEDTSALLNGGTYNYKIKSRIPNSQEYLEFSKEVSITYHSNIPTEKVFWIEELYHEWSIPTCEDELDVCLKNQFLLGTRYLYLHTIIGSYRSGDTNKITVLYKTPSSSATDPDSSYDLVDILDAGNNVKYYYTDDIDIVGEYNQDCGYACRFTGVTPTGSFDVLNGEYHNTDVNNRLASKYYPSYRMDPSSDTIADAWMKDVDYFTRLSAEANPPGSYDSMFGDSAESEFYNANSLPDWVRNDALVYGYNHALAQYRNTFTDYVVELRNRLNVYPDHAMGLIINWDRTPDWENLQYSIDGAMIEGFGSTWDWVNENNTVYLSIRTGSTWYVQFDKVRDIQDFDQAHMTSTDIYLLSEVSTGQENSLWERQWSFASYLLLADLYGENAPRVHFSHRGVRYKFQTSVREDWGYFPEMQLDMGVTNYTFPNVPLPAEAYNTQYDMQQPLSIPSQLPGNGEIGEHFLREFSNGIVLLNNPYNVNIITDMHYTVGQTNDYIYELLFDDKHILDGGRFYTVQRNIGEQITLSGGRSCILLNQPYASPLLDMSVESVIYLNQPNQRINARATSWNGEPMWFEVDASQIGLGTNLVLRPNGELYESDPIVCTEQPGSFELPVYIRDESGYALYDHITVVLATPPVIVATYEDKSSQVPIAYEGKPYSSIPLDYNQDGRDDLFVSSQDPNTQATIHYNETPPNQLTILTNSTLTVFDGVPLLAPTRGVAAGDFNRDGEIDLYIAHPSTATSPPMLFKQTNVNGLRTMHNAAGEYGLTYELCSNAWAGAWTDVNSDGYLDLYIARADNVPSGHGGDHPEVPNKTAAAIVDQLLVNQNFGKGPFYPLSETWPGQAEPTFSVAWADFDLDGDLDGIFPSVSGNVENNAFFYVNDGSYIPVNSYSDYFGDYKLTCVTSAEWVDLDNDGDFDLVLSRVSPTEEHLIVRPYVFENTENSGVRLFKIIALPATASIRTRDVRALDYNLDGWTDLLLIPDEDSIAPRILHNDGVRTKLSFYDITEAMGTVWQSNEVSGISTADFDDDGDLDLFLGRAHNDGKYFYAAQPTSGYSTNSYIRVQLQKTGGHDASAIGARVWVEDIYSSNIISGMQQISGGLGRGEQNSPILTFGLGSRTNNVRVRVQWPNGVTSNVEHAINSLVSIPDPTDPAIVPNTMICEVFQSPDQLLWFVKWNTLYAGNPAKDRVTIRRPDGGTPYTFSAYDSSVMASIVGDNPSVIHDYRFLSTPCIEGTYTIKVYTEVDGKIRTQTQLIQMPTCLEPEIIP